MILLTKTGNVGRLAREGEFSFGCWVWGARSIRAWKHLENPWKQRCGAYKTGKNQRQWNQVSAQKQALKCKERSRSQKNQFKTKIQQQNFSGMALSGIRKKEDSGTQKCSCKKPRSEYIFHKCVEWLIHMRVKQSHQNGRAPEAENLSQVR